jgi:hypothetical protein
MEASKVSRSTIAAQSLGSVKVRAHGYALVQCGAARLAAVGLRRASSNNWKNNAGARHTSY